MDNDYTPQDAGNSTHQKGDKFYKTPEEIAMLQDEYDLDDKRSTIKDVMEETADRNIF